MVSRKYLPPLCDTDRCFSGRNYYPGQHEILRACADQDLDPPDLFNLVGFVKGAVEKVAALMMFGLSGLCRASVSIRRSLTGNWLNQNICL
jgi:hypothetical protein